VLLLIYIFTFNLLLDSEWPTGPSA